MKKDIRIYSYEYGRLKKVNRHFHKHDSLESARNSIVAFRAKRCSSNHQFVIVEYTSPYESEIIEVI